MQTENYPYHKSPTTYRKTKQQQIDMLNGEVKFN